MQVDKERDFNSLKGEVINLSQSFESGGEEREIVGLEQTAFAPGRESQRVIFLRLATAAGRAAQNCVIVSLTDKRVNSYSNYDPRRKEGLSEAEKKELTRAIGIGIGRLVETKLLLV